MNKKIEELAMESCLHGYMVHLYTVYVPDGYRVPLENRMISVERFAELIVRECGNVAWKCGSEFINNEIKQHFGVKE